jgi:5'-nucleotidase
MVASGRTMKMEIHSLNQRIVMYISGIQVTYDINRPIMDRVVKVAVRCAECRVPVYEPLDLNKWYRISLCSFLVTGGDGYTVIANNSRNHVTGL